MLHFSRYNALVRESMQKLDFAAALHNNHGELAHAHWAPDRSRVEVSGLKSRVPKIDHPVYSQHLGFGVSGGGHVPTGGCKKKVAYNFA